MTRKEPELQIRTTLTKFAGFLKALALVGALVGAPVASTYYSTSLTDEEAEADTHRDSLIAALQQEMRVHDVRISNVENTNVEVKSTLTDIQTDIKKLLYMAGRNER